MINNINDIDDNDYNHLLTIIEQVKGERVRGNSIKCPFHDDKHASAGIFQSQDGRWVFSCRTCAITKTASTLYKEMTGEQPFEIKRFEGVYEPEKVPTILTLGEIKKDANIEDMYSYFDDEGLSMVVVRKVMTKPNGEKFKTFRQWKHLGNNCFSKGHPDKVKLYGWKECFNEDTVLLVEGEKCANWAIDMDIPTMSICGGANGLNYNDLTVLHDKRVILWADYDKSGVGYKTMVQVKEMLGSNAEVILPKPDDILKKFDEHYAYKHDICDSIIALRSAGHTDEEIATLLMDGLKEWWEEPKEDVMATYFDYIDKVATGWYKGYRVGWNKLIETSDLLAGEAITIVVGKSGTGKSMFVGDLARRLIEMTDAKVAWWTAEDDKNKHTLRTTAMCLGDSSWARREKIERYPDKYKEAIMKCDLAMKVREVMYDGKDRTFKSLLNWVKNKAKSEHDVIIIDPISFFDPETSKGLADATMNFLQDLDVIRMKYGCRIILVTHPRSDEGGIKMDNLAGARGWNRFTQNIIWISKVEPLETPPDPISGKFEEGVPNIVDRVIHVLKMRDGTECYGDTIGFYFDKETLRFEECCEMQGVRYQVIDK